MDHGAPRRPAFRVLASLLTGIGVVAFILSFLVHDEDVGFALFLLFLLMIVASVFAELHAEKS